MMLEHLLSAWQRVAQQISNAEHILLLLDYDGTLTPIVDRPEQAILSEETSQLLLKLARQHRVRLGIISGRALADVKNRVNIGDIIYAGNHGMEIEGPGVSFINPLAQEAKPLFRVISHVLRMAMKTVKGVLVEDKGLTLSVHYRQVEDKQTGEVKDIFERVINGAKATGRVKVTPGKKVYDVKPAIDWDKGKAIKLLMKRFGKGGRESGLVPVYIGDDLTDEDGFEVIERYGNGISVFVGDSRVNSSARYFLKSTAEVTEFLRLLLEQVKRGSG